MAYTKSGVIRNKYLETATTTTHQIQTEPVPENEVHTITRYAFRNQNRAGMKATVSILSGGTLATVLHVAEMPDNEFDLSEAKVLLVDGERLQIDFEGVQADDKIDAHLVGRVYYEPEG